MLKNHLILPDGHALFIVLYPSNETIVKCGLLGSCAINCSVEPKSSRSGCYTYGVYFSSMHLSKCNWFQYSVM